MSVTDGLSSETHSFAFDPSYRLASNAQGGRGTISYRYDPADHLASYAIQNGPTGSYAYFKSIQWSPATGQFDFGYTLSGQYGTITFPNGQHRDYTYDGPSKG